MPRLELLSEPRRLAIMERTTDERELVLHYALTSKDLTLIDRGAPHERIRRSHYYVINND